jgi:hypothetical protein
MVRHRAWVARVLLHESRNPFATGGIVGSPARIDRHRVTLASETECLYWETKLGAQRDAIRQAMGAVGDQPNTVHAWLAGRHADADSGRTGLPP